MVWKFAAGLSRCACRDTHTLITECSKSPLLMSRKNADSLKTTKWTVGTATHSITPEKPMWMAGYAMRDEPSKGVEHDLLAKAIVIKDGENNRSVIVSMDVLYVPRDLRETVVERCAAKYDLATDALMITATHTHCGPEFREFKVEMYADEDGPYLERAKAYRERLEDELVDLIGDALAESAPGRLSYSYARCGFAMNRRLPVEEGIAHVPNPDGSIDHEVPVLVVEGKSAIRAIIFGYACHTTTLSVNRFCGDWAGFAQRYIEERYPDATALFLLGCAGDQNPYPRRELDLAKQHGQSIANAVRTAVESRRKPIRGPLQTVFEEQPIQFESPPSRDELEDLRDADERYLRIRAEKLLEELEDTGTIQTEYPYPVQAFGFGDDLTLVGLGGEVLVEYGLQLKSQLPGPLWVAAYANDEFTYVPTTQTIYEGGYEGGDVVLRSSFPGKWKTDVEERILRKARALAERVSNGRMIK